MPLPPPLFRLPVFCHIICCLSRIIEATSSMNIYLLTNAMINENAYLAMKIPLDLDQIHCVFQLRINLLYTMSNLNCFANMFKWNSLIRARILNRNESIFNLYIYFNIIYFNLFWSFIFLKKKGDEKNTSNEWKDIGFSIECIVCIFIENCEKSLGIWFRTR